MGNSPLRAPRESEQQTLVLRGMKAHTVGQARSTRVKPSISRWACSRLSIILFHGLWCAPAHELLLAKDDPGGNE